MAQNYINSGDVFDYTVPASTTIASGDVVIMAAGGAVGVALGGGTTGDVIPVKTCGVFEVAKLTTSGNVFAQGAKVYHDGTTATIVDTDEFIGYAYTAAIQADTVVEVKLKL